MNKIMNYFLSQKLKILDNHIIEFDFTLIFYCFHLVDFFFIV